MTEANAQFTEQLTTLNAEISRVGDYVLALVAQGQRTDMTPEEEAANLAALKAAGERLKAIGAAPGAEIPADAPILPEVPSTDAV